MSVRNYMMAKVIYAVVYFFTLAIILLFFIFFNIQVEYFLLVFCVSFITFISFLIAHYIILYRNFSTMLKSIKGLENSEFILYMYDKPADFESQIIYNIVKEVNDKLYYKYKKEIDKQSDYQDYINMWIHEVKLPIQNIKNLTLKYDDEGLNNEIDYLTFLVDNSLTLSKINFSDFTFSINRIHMKKVLNNIIKQNFNKINYAKCKIEVEIQDYEVYIDEYWISFMINQLIDNSVKYKASEIKISGNVINDKYVISVHDNGLGIYEDEIPYIFNKFYIGSHTKKYVSSTGFGLYMLKQIAEELNINIKVKSRVDVYTEVMLELPLDRKEVNVDEIVDIVAGIND